MIRSFRSPALAALHYRGDPTGVPPGLGEPIRQTMLRLGAAGVLGEIQHLGLELYGPDEDGRFSVRAASEAFILFTFDRGKVFDVDLRHCPEGAPPAPPVPRTPQRSPGASRWVLKAGRPVGTLASR